MGIYICDLCLNIYFLGGAESQAGLGSQKLLKLLVAGVLSSDMLTMTNRCIKDVKAVCSN